MKIIIAVFFMIFSSVCYSLPGFDISRLPDTVAKQVVLSGGEVSTSIPTSVSNSGILGGSILRWQHNDSLCYDNGLRDESLCIDQEGNYKGISELIGEAGYLYDLENENFIAQEIIGHSVYHVADSFYIGKKLQLDTLKWQTLRCEISALVLNLDGSHSNPSCLLIDDDSLDAEPYWTSGCVQPHDCEDPRSFWSQRYITVMMVGRVLLSPMASNSLGSTIIWDIPDDVTGPDSFNFAWSGGQVEPQGDVYSDLLSLVSEEGSLAGGNLGEISGNDVLWAWVAGRREGVLAETEDDCPPVLPEEECPATPDKIYQFTRFSPGNYSVISHVFSDILPGGLYNRVLNVSKNGLIYTQKGTCQLLGGCSVLDDFSLALSVENFIHVATNNRVLYLYGSSQNLDHSYSPPRRKMPVTDLRGLSHAEYDIFGLITHEYGDYFWSEHKYFYPSIYSNTYNVGSFTAVAESGEYFVVTGIDSGGIYRAYLFKSN